MSLRCLLYQVNLLSDSFYSHLTHLIEASCCEFGVDTQTENKIHHDSSFKFFVSIDCTSSFQETPFYVQLNAEDLIEHDYSLSFTSQVCLKTL